MTESHRDVMMKTSVTPDLESVCPLGRADLAWLRNMGQARAGRDGPKLQAARQERPAVSGETEHSATGAKQTWDYIRLTISR